MINRRTLLKGIGVGLALPWLEIMAEAAEVNHSPVRMAALFMPNGVREDTWMPNGTGSNFQLSQTLSPLEPVKDKIIVPTGLWNQASDFGDGHYVKTSGLLTCTTINKTLGIDLNANGVSMDQVAARHSEKETPLPSLELAIDPVTIGVDTNVGYTRVYGSHIAWKGPKMPLAREINPKLVYERMFRVIHRGNKTAVRDKQLLDLVLGDVKQMRQRLGGGDKRRLDEYLESVRSLEVRLQRSIEGSEWKPLYHLEKREYTSVPESHEEHVKLMMDMIVWAFQTDVTRVATFMFGNSVSGKNFAFIDGVNSGHHQVSHHQNEEQKLKEYELIARWHVEQYAYLLRRLREVKEGDRDLLYNSEVLFASGLKDGNSHNPHDLPVLLGGSAAGRLNTGQHLVYDRDTPMSCLYNNMLDAFGVEHDGFADSSSVRLAGISA